MNVRTLLLKEKLKESEENEKTLKQGREEKDGHTDKTQPTRASIIP